MTPTDKDRSELLGEYMVKNKATVRSTAKVFGVSKSTVHKDLTTKLEKTDTELYEKVRKILDINKAERHLRGGFATKKMYYEKRQKEKCV